MTVEKNNIPAEFGWKLCPDDVYEERAIEDAIKKLQKQFDIANQQVQVNLEKNAKLSMQLLP